MDFLKQIQKPTLRTAVISQIMQIIKIPKKISRKLLTNQKLGSIIHSKFEYHKNDCDEDGRFAKLRESCRVVQGNGGAFQ